MPHAIPQRANHRRCAIQIDQGRLFFPCRRHRHAPASSDGTWHSPGRPGKGSPMRGHRREGGTASLTTPRRR
jgi:hypothetical protein